MIAIAFVIDTIESPTAGTEKQLLLLLKHLDRTRFAPCLCVLRSSPWLREEFDLCELYEADIPSFKSLAALRNLYRLSRFFREKKIAVVQTHFRDGSIAGILAAQLAGVKAVIGTRRNQGYWYTPLEVQLQKFLNYGVTGFIANSESTRHWAEATEGISCEKLHVIHNAVDLEPFRNATAADRDAVRMELGIPPAVPVAGIVANLRLVKGLEVFLRAASLVRGRLPEAHFVVVGEGDERHKLELLAEELGIRAVACFAGRRTDIPRLLKAFDVGVLSSHSESFSNAVVEYLAAGLPVVCTDVGGCRECIREGVNGFVVPVGDHDALARGILAVFSGALDGNLKERTSMVAEQFSLTGVITKHQKLYEDLSCPVKG